MVLKSKRSLFLYNDEQLLKTFLVVFGGNRMGHKQQEGDKRTPEGKYILDFKKADSAFYKAIHISYHNAQDIENAKKRGVNPGSSIMIHGQKNGFSFPNLVPALPGFGSLFQQKVLPILLNALAASNHFL